MKKKEKYVFKKKNHNVLPPSGGFNLRACYFVLSHTRLWPGTIPKVPVEIQSDNHEITLIK